MSNEPEAGANRRGENECYDPLCEIHNKPAPATGEWTEAKISKIYWTKGFTGLAAAINAALAAERERAEMYKRLWKGVEPTDKEWSVIRRQEEANQQLREQLAAEREKLNTYIVTVAEQEGQLREQLDAAVEALKELRTRQRTVALEDVIDAALAKIKG